MLIKGKGDKRWYLDYIGTLSKGNHELFRKDYVPPKKKISE